MRMLLLCRFVQTAAAVLLAGAMTLRLLARDTAAASISPPKSLAWNCAGALLAAGVIQLWLTAAEMSGLPPMQAGSGEVLGGVMFGTLFGAVWRVRLALLAGWSACEWLRRWGRPRGRRPRIGSGLDLAGALLAAALLASLVWSGHAHASGHRAWLLPSVGLHAVAAGVWPGGLLPLAVLLARASRDPALLPAAGTITRRFSHASLAAVGVLAVTGGLNACGLAGTSWSASLTGLYGRLLWCKAALFVCMAGLGAVNRGLIRRNPSAGAPDGLRQLRLNVVVESVLAAGVLLAAEALAMSAPPASGA